MEPHQALVAIAIPVTAILGLVGLLVILRKFENDEKMAMIEKGLTPPQKEGTRVNPASALRWGCLFMGVGLGIFIANLMSSIKDESDALYPALILFFGGLGLLISYYIQLQLDRKEK